MNNNKLVVSCGQAHELEMAFARYGWTNEDIKSLTKGGTLEQFLAVLKGQSSVEPVHQLIINTNERPEWLAGSDCWKVEKHAQFGLMRFSTAGVEIYSSSEGKWKQGHLATHMTEKQKSRDFAEVTEGLLKELETKIPLNSVVLDFLLSHTEFIPQHWKDFYVGFTGTIYKLTNNPAAGGAMDTYRSLHWCHTNERWEAKLSGAREQLKRNTPAAIFKLS
jgi:hypothetical protein